MIIGLREEPLKHQLAQTAITCCGSQGRCNQAGFATCTVIWVWIWCTTRPREWKTRSQYYQKEMSPTDSSRILTRPPMLEANLMTLSPFLVNKAGLWRIFSTCFLGPAFIQHWSRTESAGWVEDSIFKWWWSYDTSSDHNFVIQKEKSAFGLLEAEEIIFFFLLGMQLPSFFYYYYLDNTGSLIFRYI